MSRAARSFLFLVIYSIYVVLVMAPVQRLFLWPLVTVLASRRAAIMRFWLKLQAHIILWLARIGGLRLAVQGAIPPESCIVLMNHQSLLDIPIGVSLVTGPYPLIPTRASYRRGIPGISMAMRLARCPFLEQREVASRSELVSLLAAANEVARGDQSFLLYPEGHRSPDGELQPFMVSGLLRVMARARQRPVYLIVVDGLWHLRTLADTARELAGSTARVVILGPYTVPRENSELAPFVEFLRDRMAESLTGLRLAAARLPTLDAHPRLAR